MTRAVNEGYARVVAGHMSKRRISSEKAAEAVADAENPRCPECGSITVYAEGRYGPYYFCESECGWKKNQRSLERTASRRKVPNAGQATDLPDKGAACPKCGSETRLRSGRFGPFYGCVELSALQGKEAGKIGVVIDKDALMVSLWNPSTAPRPRPLIHAAADSIPPRPPLLTDGRPLGHTVILWAAQPDHGAESQAGIPPESQPMPSTSEPTGANWAAERREEPQATCNQET